MINTCTNAKNDYILTIKTYYERYDKLKASINAETTSLIGLFRSFASASTTISLLKDTIPISSVSLVDDRIRLDKNNTIF
jgi:hypothetical protein